MLAFGLLFFELLGAGAPIAKGQTLSLIWSDEFNSATSSNVDTTKWVFESGNNGGWGNNEKEFYTSRTNNAYIASGLLHIHAQVELTNTFRFTSARMKTETKFWFKYGRVEWRAKLPAGVGMWPALWMMGTNIANLAGRVAAKSMWSRIIGTPTFNQGSLHNGGTLTGQTSKYFFTSPDAITNFHTYYLDWASNSISWSVDGTVFQTLTNWSSSTGNLIHSPSIRRFSCS